MSEVKKDVVVIHHNDLDGYGALAVIYKKFVKTYNVVNFEFNYNTTFESIIKPLDLNKIEALFIVDCNMNGEEELHYLNAIESMFPDKIGFIDHHEKSYELRSQMKFDNVVDKSLCGAKLTLNKFYPTERNEIYEYIDMFDRFQYDSLKEYNKSDLLSSLCSLVDKKAFVRNLAYTKTLDELFSRYSNLIPALKDEYKVILSDKFSPIVDKGKNSLFFRLDFKAVNPLFYPNVNMIRLNKKNAPITVYFSKYYANPSTVKFSIRVDSTQTDININDVMLEKCDYLIKGGGHQFAFGGSVKMDDVKRLISDIKSIEV